MNLWEKIKESVQEVVEKWQPKIQAEAIARLAADVVGVHNEINIRKKGAA